MVKINKTTKIDNQMTLGRLTLFVGIFILTSCNSSNKKTVVNEDGDYTVEILPEWDYRLEGANTRIHKTKLLDTKSVSGTLLVTTMESAHETLDESFNYLVGGLPDSFTDYRKISEGETEINGILAKWNRMEDTDNNIRYVTLQYIMQPIGKNMIVINCSSTKDAFNEFEEDFNKIAFTLKTIKK